MLPLSSTELFRNPSHQIVLVFKDQCNVQIKLPGWQPSQLFKTNNKEIKQLFTVYFFNVFWLSIIFNFLRIILAQFLYYFSSKSILFNVYWNHFIFFLGKQYCCVHLYLQKWSWLKILLRLLEKHRSMDLSILQSHHQKLWGLPGSSCFQLHWLMHWSKFPMRQSVSEFVIQT